jgi:hypothetical protein
MTLLRIFKSKKGRSMKRNLKALGLALLAVCAVGATVAAASASAEDKFTCAGVSNCDVTGTGSNTTFGTKSSSLTTVCSTEKYSGTVTNGASEITVTPAYEGCTMLGNSYPLVMNGCDYILTGNTTARLKTDGATQETDAATRIACPEGKAIESKGSGCTVKVPGNQTLHGVTYVNEGTGSTQDIKINITVDSIEYTSAGFGCAFAGIPAKGTDGTLTGTVTYKAYTHNSSHQTSDHVGLAVDTA